MIQRQAMRDATATVVAADEVLPVAERPHQRADIGGHRALAVRLVVRARGGSGGIAIATQVRHYEREMRGKQRSDAMPHRVRLRESVQQQQRRTLADAPVHDAHALVVEGLELNTGEEFGHGAAP